jgi:hypothetical protein
MNTTLLADSRRQNPPLRRRLISALGDWLRAIRARAASGSFAGWLRRRVRRAPARMPAPGPDLVL